MIMIKRVLALLLALCMSVGFLPHTAVSAAENTAISRPAFSGKLIEVSGQRVEDTFAYLDEVYIDAYPEAALEVFLGTENDREVLKTLSGIITEGCTTEKEKVDAIDDWLRRNILYDVNASAYPMDAFYNRKGNCLSYALLMEALVRLAGVPAIAGDGWRGDLSAMGVELLDMEGHAWCFVYLDGEWVLYDPLWLDGGTTDREYIAKWIYLDRVGYVIPASDSKNLPPVSYDACLIYYTDGVWYGYSDFLPSGAGNMALFVNNMTINFTSNQCEDGISDGWIYLDGQDKSQMRMGEVYRDGWISYDDARTDRHCCLAYAHFNGAQYDGYVKQWNGADYMMCANNSMKILASKDVYSIQYGTFTLPVGYTGVYFEPPYGKNIGYEETVKSIESMNPEILTINEDGTVTTHEEGFAMIEYTVRSSEDNGLLSINHVNLYVSDEDRTPNYEDIPIEQPTEPSEPPVQPSEPPAEPSEPSTEPTEPSVMPSEPEEDPLPQFTDVPADQFYTAPVAWAVDMGITKGETETEFRPDKDCTRGQVMTFIWRANGCPEPKSMNHSFTDLDPNKFYYKAVIWAVEQGITTGKTATTFEPNATCTRSQVVTFLWRAAGKPAPVSANSFPDVGTDAYYYQAVLWAVEQGITNGFKDGTFGPTKFCNRGQIVTFLYRDMN